jgi:hypothetical protein
VSTCVTRSVAASLRSPTTSARRTGTSCSNVTIPKPHVTSTATSAASTGFFLHLRVVGSTMGARDGFAAMESGDVFGKVVFTSP